MKETGSKELLELLGVAEAAAKAAGAVVMDRYASPHQIRYKGEIDLVTEADLASEEVLLSRLGETGVRVMAEESSGHGRGVEPQDPAWIVDPLDGTTNFAHGFPWFGISIGYWDKGRVQAGVIYLPVLDELFSAARGHGARLNGRAIEVSWEETLSRSLLATGFPYDIHQDPDEVMAAMRAVLVRAQGIRRAGAAALDMAYVACGRLDGFWEIKLKPWDTAAGMVLVEEAGGRVTDFSLGEYTPFGQEILSTNGRIHEALSTILSPFSAVPEG